MNDQKKETLLHIKELRKYFPIKNGFLSRTTANVKAVQDISFTIGRGETVGLVGESGSGKTTAGRTILKLLEPTDGEIWYDEENITHLSRQEMLSYRRKMQVVFQDPSSALSPKMRVEDIVGEGITIQKLIQGKEKREKVASLLTRVGLSRSHMRRFVHEFSGGQRQRIAIARALAVDPEFLVADEPVSALDVSIQAQVVNLLDDLKSEFGLTMLFIAHDLAVVEYLADRIVVMYLGRIMEVAPATELFSNPVHPYTEALLEAIPSPDPTTRKERSKIKGDIPSPINPPSGCVFRSRCPLATQECAEVVPPLEQVSPGHFKACIKR